MNTGLQPWPSSPKAGIDPRKVTRARDQQGIQWLRKKGGGGVGMRREASIFLTSHLGHLLGDWCQVTH